MQVCEIDWCAVGLHLIRTSLMSLMAAKSQRVKWWRSKDWRLLSLLLSTCFSHQTFLFLTFLLLFQPYLLTSRTRSSQPPIPRVVFVSSLEQSSPAVRADTGVWFVRVNVIQRSIRSIRPMPWTPGGLGLCLAKPLMEAKPLLGKPLRAQQAQKNEPPLSLHIRSSATVTDPPQTPSRLTTVCPSLWTRDN